VKSIIVNTAVRLYVGISRIIAFIISTANSEDFAFKNKEIR
jgi:hypothetical protein